MTNFHRFKLGFDRTFWIGEIAERSQAAVYEVALASQQAALSVLRPGVHGRERACGLCRGHPGRRGMTIRSAAVGRPGSAFWRRRSW